MHNVQLAQKIESQEDLMRICSNRFKVDSDILSEALDHVAKIHAVRFEGESVTTASVFACGRAKSSPQTLEYQAKMTAMLECPL